MSVTPELRASARATYRLLFRTAENTFRGDERVLNGFREKVRNEYRQGRSVTDASAYSARIQLGREVADVLRKNVVQGVKVKQGQASRPAPSVSVSAQDVAGDVWRVRLAKDTELGSNETVKMNSGSRSAHSLEGRQSCCQSTAPVSASAESLSSSESYLKEINDEFGYEIEVKNTENHPGASESIDVPTGEQQDIKKKYNYSTLKRLSQTRLKPVLNEDDLEETFVRGSGPGGQSINKTSNNVQLLHKPTGIRVTCQETRSLQSNRLIARKNLIEKLDQIANPGLSKENLKRAKQVERERRRRKKAKKKARAKDGEEDSD